MELRVSRTMVRFILLILIAYAFVTMTDVHSRLEAARREAAALEQREERLREENAQLQYDIDHVMEEESIERIARQRLGLVMPNEIITEKVGD